MNCCSDVATLTAIACMLSEILSVDELSILSSNLVALGDMLDVIITRIEQTAPNQEND